MIPKIEIDFMVGDTIEYYYYSFEHVGDKSKGNGKISDTLKTRGFLIAKSLAPVGSGGCIISQKKPILNVRLVLIEKTLFCWGKSYKLLV